MKPALYIATNNRVALCVQPRSVSRANVGTRIIISRGYRTSCAAFWPYFVSSGGTSRSVGRFAKRQIRDDAQTVLSMSYFGGRFTYVA